MWEERLVHAAAKVRCKSKVRCPGALWVFAWGALVPHGRKELACTSAQVHCGSGREVPQCIVGGERLA